MALNKFSCTIKSCLAAALFCILFVPSSAADATPVTRADLMFLAMLKHAVMRNRPDIIADHIAYPVEIFFGTGECKYRNREEFINNYEIIFNRPVVAAIKLQKISRSHVQRSYDEFTGHDSIEIGDGELSVEIHKTNPHELKSGIRSTSPYQLFISPDTAAQKALLKHPSAAAGARLQALDAKLAAACPSAPPAPPQDNSAWVAQPNPDQPVTPAALAFFKILKRAVAQDRPDIIAKHVSYPLRVNFGGGLFGTARSCYIQSSARFIRDYAAIFNADVKKVIADQSLDPKQIFATDLGFMFDDGAVWILSELSDRGKGSVVYSLVINADLVAANMALDTPSAATGAHLQSILRALHKACPVTVRSEPMQGTPGP